MRSSASSHKHTLLTCAGVECEHTMRSSLIHPAPAAASDSLHSTCSIVLWCCRARNEAADGAEVARKESLAGLKTELGAMKVCTYMQRVEEVYHHDDACSSSRGSCG
jgi:hypothetical protein